MDYNDLKIMLAFVYSVLTDWKFMLTIGYMVLLFIFTVYMGILSVNIIVNAISRAW